MARMNKEQMKGGLNALFGDSLPHKEEIAPEPPTTPEPTSTEIINSVEDEELKAALHKRRMAHRGRPKKSEGADGSFTEGYGRATTIVNLEKMAKLREIAKRETLTIKEVIEATMDLAISTYEAKHGKIRIYPEEERGDVTKLFKL